jgi:hypothetical protein
MVFYLFIYLFCGTRVWIQGFPLQSRYFTAWATSSVQQSLFLFKKEIDISLLLEQF